MAVDARPAPVRVGTVVWLASEVMFFAGLFAAYFTIRAMSPIWPPADVDLGVAQAGAFTVVLLGSSVTAQGAVRASENRDARRTRTWLAWTVLLGAAFLGNQAVEWRDAGFSVSSHAYGSMYFLLTGFHGLHVLGGLVALLLLAARTAVEAAGERQESAVAVVVAYWHFVDVVWLAVFASLFLLR